MNKFRIKPLALALLTIAAGAQQYAFADTEPRLHEEASVTPGRSISAADEQVISSSAYRVLHHITRAREELRRKNIDAAKQEIKQANTLLEIIEKTVPTSIVKNRVWTSDNKLAYENTEEVPADSVPIYVTMDEQMEFNATKLPGAATHDSKPDSKAQARPDDKQAAQPDQAKGAPAPAEETVARDAALHYEEVDLPLKLTRQLVDNAQAALAKNLPDEAERHLAAALNGVNSIDAYLPTPLMAARVNLERAEAHYGAGDGPQAKVDMERAIRQLTEAQKQADTESQPDVKQMLDEAMALKVRMETNEAGLAAAVRSLWRRTEAQAERTLAYAAFGWAKLHPQDPLRSALIEAKRCVSYADIDANVGGEAARAKHDLEQAKVWLDKAAKAADARTGAASPAVIDQLRSSVDNLLAGQGKTDPAELAKLKQQLSQAITHA